MTILVDDTRQTVMLAGFDGSQLRQLASIVRLARKSDDAQVKLISKGLHLYVPRLCGTTMTIPLLQLTWAETFDLCFVVKWALDLFPNRHQPFLRLETLEALDVALTSITDPEHDKARG